MTSIVAAPCRKQNHAKSRSPGILRKQLELNRILLIALAILVLPLLIAITPLLLLWGVVWSGVLRVWFWRAHVAQGRCVMFVYSESPNWQTYIEANILPRIREKSVVLNWSARRNWAATCPWEARFFRQFAGAQDFNPIALVYCNGRIRRIRFHQPFLDYKHGKAAALRKAEVELFGLVDTDETGVVSSAI
jgi:hypothetical protein